MQGMIRKTNRLLALAGTALLLTACEPRHVELVVDACVRDGMPVAYCECTAENMKAQAGFEDYAIFTDIIRIGGNSAPNADEMFSIMQSYNLAPGHLNESMASLERATKRTYAICRG